MAKLTIPDIGHLPAYERLRPQSLAKNAELLATRRVLVTDGVAVTFENRDTLRSLLLETATTRNTTSPRDIVTLLAAYNPIVPERNEITLSLESNVAGSDAKVTIKASGSVVLEAKPVEPPPLPVDDEQPDRLVFVGQLDDEAAANLLAADPVVEVSYGDASFSTALSEPLRQSIQADWEAA